MKKDKYSWFHFYIVRTLVSITAGVAYMVEIALELVLFISGHWYCEHCEKHHNRRTLRYCVVEFDYCYRAMRRWALIEARDNGTPLHEIPLSVDSVWLGGENVTTEIKQLAAKGGFWK